MYEHMTYETILSSLLARVEGQISTGEGSLIRMALAPAAFELESCYIELDQILKEMFADTASREYLIKRAAERGITIKPASNAILKGEFNIDIPIGSRFSLRSLNYVAVEKMTARQYKMQCETAGSIGNRLLGELTSIGFIEGLESAELTEVLIPGEDEEGTEHLRERYFDSLASQAFGGNIADYREKVHAMAGVGGVKVFPVWNGGGTVKIILINSEYRAPSAELVSQVKEALDPTEKTGEGYGLAPIGHVVTVEGAAETPVSVKTFLTYQEGWSYETCEQGIFTALDIYFDELNRLWEGTESTIIRVSQVESRLLDVEGVLDVTGTMLNGSGGNLELAGNCIAVRGDFDGAGG